MGHKDKFPKYQNQGCPFRIFLKPENYDSLQCYSELMDITSCGKALEKQYGIIMNFAKT